MPLARSFIAALVVALSLPGQEPSNYAFEVAGKPAAPRVWPLEGTPDLLKTGDIVTIDLDRDTLTVHATGKSCRLKPLGEVRPVIDAGGLFEYARQTGMIARTAQPDAREAVPVNRVGDATWSS